MVFLNKDFNKTWMQLYPPVRVKNRTLATSSGIYSTIVLDAQFLFFNLIIYFLSQLKGREGMVAEAGSS